MSTITLHRKLLLSTATLMGAMTGYGQSARAACVTTTAPNVVCSGAETNQQSTSIPNSQVTTVPGFSVITASTNGLRLVGNGQLRFTDMNASVLTGTARGLFFQSANDIGPLVGGATGIFNSTLTGNARGVEMRLFGSGQATIRTYGQVTGLSPSGTGVLVNNYNGTDVTIYSGTASNITGGGAGIAGNTATGAVSITANGRIHGTNYAGIDATTAGTDIRITTGANSVVTSGFYGVRAVNTGSGVVEITTDGTVDGGAGDGVYAHNSTGTDIRITTNDTASGGNSGIRAVQDGTGVLEIIANDDVTGIIAVNNADTALTITTSADSTVMGGTHGIHATTTGTGPMTITTNGDITGTDGFGIFARSAGGDIILDTLAGSTVTGSTTGLYIRQDGGGGVDFDLNFNVVGAGDDGIYVRQSAGAPIGITIASGMSVTSTGMDADDFAVQTVDGPSTLVVAGTLNGGAGGAVGFGALNDRLELHTTGVVNGNALGGGGTDTLAFAGTGSGSFDLGTIDDGSNTLQFQGFEAFVVESATWTLDGITGANFVVNGGTVKGNGTFGGLTVNNGGVLSPGNSFGTVTVNGAFRLNSGAIFEVEVNEDGMGDLVVVNGTVNLTGSTLRLLAAPGTYELENEYVIIDNDGTDAVVGTFGTITSSLAFLAATVSYTGGTGNDVVLMLERIEIDPCDVANSQNQSNTCGAIDQDSSLFLSILGQTVAGARQAFDALSGEVHATIAGVLVDDNRYVREAILGRLMQAGHTDGNGQLSALGAAGPQVASLDQNSLDSSAMALGGKSLSGKSLGSKSLAPPPRAPIAFWTAAYGAWGSYNGDGNAATADRDLGGFMSGMDASIGGSWRLGLTTGASFSKVTVGDRHSSADAESYYLGGYTGGMVGAFALRGGGTWAWSDIDTSRAVIFPGFYERQKASYNADTGQLFGEVAYPTTAGNLSVEPFAGLAYVGIDTDRFLEHGGAEASLRGRGTDQNVGYSTLGFRAATTSQWGSTLVSPHLSVAWQHAFDDVTPTAALAFATSGSGFDVAGVPLAEDSAIIDAGLDFALGENTTAGLSYSGQFGEGVHDNAVKGRFTLLF